PSNSSYFHPILRGNLSNSSRDIGWPSVMGGLLSCTPAPECSSGCHCAIRHRPSGETPRCAHTPIGHAYRAPQEDAAPVVLLAAQNVGRPLPCFNRPLPAI